MLDMLNSKQKRQHHLHHRPRLDRRNAIKNIDYSAGDDLYSPSSSSNSFSDDRSSVHKTRSLDLLPLSDRTSFRMEGIEGEADQIFRYLGLNPEDLSIPVAAWEARKSLSGEVEDLVSGDFDGENQINSKSIGNSGLGVKGIRPSSSAPSSDIRMSIEDSDPSFGAEDGVELVPDNDEVRAYEASESQVILGIKGCRPPNLAPPPVLTRSIVDCTSSTWDIFRGFGPERNQEPESPREAISRPIPRVEDSEEVRRTNFNRRQEVSEDAGEKERGVGLGSSSDSSFYEKGSSSIGSIGKNNHTISPSGSFRTNITSWQKGDFLGSGSFGTVYEGFTDDGLFFAVKEVSLLDQGSQGQQSIFQLEQEISLLRQFQHENIVRYLGTDKDDAKLYIFLELVTKGSLAKLYQKYQLRDSQVSSYTRQILSGLNYLHSRNVVHRDIKCANILVDVSGSVKLADFGLAKATKLNDIKSCKGTPFWMAPEVVNQRNHGYGLGADIWSLGCTVLEMLTGQIPYSHLEGGVEVQPVKKVCPVMLNAIQSFLPYYSSFQEKHPKLMDFLKKSCTKLMKILIAFQQRHPYSFGDQNVIGPIVDFCLNKITNPEPDVLSFEEFLIQCMVMMKCVLECKEYMSLLTGRVKDDNRVSIQDMKRNVSSVIAGFLASLLPSERVVLLCNILIRRYFVLTASDVEQWYQNPESFYHEQDSILWSERLRPCAEALYIILFENNSQLLAPVVLSILQEAMNGCPSAVSEINSQLLLKDAAYGAAAYTYYELSNHLSFKDWFNGALSFELTNNNPNMRIIHRRVALILGQWVSEIKDDTRRPVYSALTKLLQEGDLCVRLAASRSLYFHIEDANFSELDFSDLLPVCWKSCFKLVEDVEEFDSKVQVLNTISSLIGRITKVIPYADKLVMFFQKVWKESSGESLLQIQLLIALKNFVAALGDQSSICYNVLMPILQSVINANIPDELLEDSMLLWEATLTHATSMVPQLLVFFPCLMEILDRSFDYLKVAASIIEGYIVLGGLEFLNVHAQTLAKLLDLVIGNVNDKGLLSILPLVDVLIQCFPSEVPPVISTSLQKLIIICLSGGDDHDPSKMAVKTSSASILARILVMNTNYLAQLTSDPLLLAHLQKDRFSNEESILLCLVDVWLDKVDNVSSTQRKTFALALSIILTLRMSQVLDKLEQILSVCTSVILGGTEELAEEESSSYNMQSSKLEVPIKELRWRQIKFSDPINQIPLENSLKDNLQTCSALHGELFNTAMSNIHPSSLSELKRALNMP